MSELTASQIKAKMGIKAGAVPVRFRQDPKMSYYLDNSPNEEYGFFKDKNGDIKRRSFKDVIVINGKPITFKSQLKELKQMIKEEIEDFKSSEPLTFEGNPLEFILQKYPSLDATMIDLLTPSFRDYVTGIFIIAPKPTTFRILLHNNQEFHLIYSPQAYIAKIAGKKYNLINLSEEEFAINSIAQLLELGMPPGSEGPAEENKNEADLQNASEETPAEIPVETPPEEETTPELKESFKRFRIKM
jgi:hypothetical protein